MISKPQQNQVMAVIKTEPGLNKIMDKMPKNLLIEKANNCVKVYENDIEMSDVVEPTTNLNIVSPETTINNPGENLISPPDHNSLPVKPIESVSETKIHLSFSVDRLLSCEQSSNDENTTSTAKDSKLPPEKCCENSINTIQYSCCSFPNCLIDNQQQHELQQRQQQQQQQQQQHQQQQQLHLKLYQNSNNNLLHSDNFSKIYHHHHGSAISPISSYMDFKSVLRPTPIRAIGNNCEAVSLHVPFSTLATSSLIRFHQHHQQQQPKLTLSHHHTSAHPNLTLPPLMAPLSGFKSLQINQHVTQHFQQTSTNRCFQSKANHGLIDIPSATTHQQQQHHAQQSQLQQLTTASGGNAVNSGNTNSNNNNNSSNNTNGKRKRSWSRAVFSNLQRKGLEIQFQQQKYITKPDRRKLAARLNLTDAQVKVWFQNRRMKWRHTRENLKSGQEKQVVSSNANESSAVSEKPCRETEEQREMGYSSDGSSSVEMSENEDDDDDEIDVVQ